MQLKATRRSRFQKAAWKTAACFLKGARRIAIGASPPPTSRRATLMQRLSQVNAAERVHVCVAPAAIDLFSELQRHRRG